MGVGWAEEARAEGGWSWWEGDRGGESEWEERWLKRDSGYGVLESRIHSREVSWKVFDFEASSSSTMTVPN